MRELYERKTSASLMILKFGVLSFIFALGVAMMVAGARAADWEAPRTVLESSDDRSGFYISGFGSAIFPEDIDFTLGAAAFNGDTKDGYRFGGALGYRFNPWLRAEIEASYGMIEVTAGPVTADLAQTTGMVNGYVDIDIGLALVPYLGLGAGFTNVSDDVFNRDNYILAGQGIAGVTLQLNDTFDIFAEYRYFRTVAGQIGPVDFPEGLTNHQIGGGIRLNF